MLGFDALGRLSLGQVVETSTAALPAFGGSVSLTGEAATFQDTLVASPGGFSLTGAAAAFRDALVASPGSFARTGGAATFAIFFSEAQGVTPTVEQQIGAGAIGELALGQGVGGRFGPVGTISLSFALTGEPVISADTEIALAGSFALSRIDTFLSWDYLGGGGTLVAGTFSRGRWRALQEELAAERESERRKRAEEKRRRREAREAAAAAEREHREAAWARIDVANAAAAAERALAHARAVAAHIERERNATRHAAVLHALATAAQEQARAQDEDEALALLLAA